MTDVGLAKECCHKALSSKWEDGKIVICGGCFLPYTAFVAREVDPVSGLTTEVPSWWTGLLGVGG